MSIENSELVRRLLEAFNAGHSLVDDFFAEDAEVWPDPGFLEAGPFKGRDQIRRFFDGLREGWKPGAPVVVQELDEAGDKVLVSFTWHATGEASGLETSSDWMAVYTVRGGQVVRLQFFSDRAAATTAAGLN